MNCQDINQVFVLVVVLCLAQYWLTVDATSCLRPDKQTYRHTLYDGSQKRCSLCPEGEFLVDYCTDSEDTGCALCPLGTYNPEPNKCRACIHCQSCHWYNGLRYAQNCTSTMPSICECLPGMKWVGKEKCDYPTCPRGKYRNGDECSPHTLCRAGDEPWKRGTPYLDTKCRPCPNNTYSRRPSATKKCRPQPQCDGLPKRVGTDTIRTRCSRLKLPTLTLLPLNGTDIVDKPQGVIPDIIRVLPPTLNPNEQSTVTETPVDPTIEQRTTLSRNSTSVTNGMHGTSDWITGQELPQTTMIEEVTPGSLPPGSTTLHISSTLLVTKLTYYQKRSINIIIGIAVVSGILLASWCGFVFCWHRQKKLNKARLENNFNGFNDLATSSFELIAGGELSDRTGQSSSPEQSLPREGVEPQPSQMQGQSLSPEHGLPRGGDESESQMQDQSSSSVPPPSASTNQQPIQTMTIMHLNGLVENVVTSSSGEDGVFHPQRSLERPIYIPDNARLKPKGERKDSTSSNSPEEKPKRCPPPPPKRRPPSAPKKKSHDIPGPSRQHVVSTESSYDRVCSSECQTEGNESSSLPPFQTSRLGSAAGNRSSEEVKQSHPETRETVHRSRPCPSGHLTPPDEEYANVINRNGIMIDDPESGVDSAMSDPSSSLDVGSVPCPPGPQPNDNVVVVESEQPPAKVTKCDGGEPCKCRGACGNDSSLITYKLADCNFTEVVEIIAEGLDLYTYQSFLTYLGIQANEMGSGDFRCFVQDVLQQWWKEDDEASIGLVLDALKESGNGNLRDEVIKRFCKLG